MTRLTSATRSSTRGSSRLPLNRCASGPRAHVPTAGTTSATTTLASDRPEPIQGSAQREPHTKAANQDPCLRAISKACASPGGQGLLGPAAPIVHQLDCPDPDRELVA